MPKCSNSRTGLGKTLLVWAMQAHTSCCGSCEDAASAGHYECFKLLIPIGPRKEPDREMRGLLWLAIGRGHVTFASRMLEEEHVDAYWFADYCIETDDAESLGVGIGFYPETELEALCWWAATLASLRCLRLLLERGVHWRPSNLLTPVIENRPDILEVVLPHTAAWCPMVPTTAACLGRVRFLMLIFDAGCPLWTSANDANAQKVVKTVEDAGFDGYEVEGFAGVDGGCLVVSSNLVRSGPVLLYAAQKGAPLTPRMEGMLGDVRCRALALAGCFHRAARLRRQPGARARKWDAMGRVPVEVVERIATLAKLSIIVVDLVE